MARTHYLNGAEVGLPGNGCDGCSVCAVNGIIVHEQGCPYAWMDQKKSCFDCGTDFYPEAKGVDHCQDCLRPAENEDLCDVVTAEGGRIVFAGSHEEAQQFVNDFYERNPEEPAGMLVVRRIEAEEEEDEDSDDDFYEEGRFWVLVGGSDTPNLDSGEYAIVDEKLGGWKLKTNDREYASSIVNMLNDQ